MSQKIGIWVNAIEEKMPSFAATLRRVWRLFRLINREAPHSAHRLLVPDWFEPVADGPPHLQAALFLGARAHCSSPC
jgi:hypothetical protein